MPQNSRSTIGMGLPVEFSKLDAVRQGSEGVFLSELLDSRPAIVLAGYSTIHCLIEEVLCTAI